MVKKAEISIIILAAGKGTRMKSNLPKVMHKVAGREMINMVIDEAKKLNPKNISIVVSEEMSAFEESIIANHDGEKISFIIQKHRKGTAHAVKTALDKISDLGKKVLILYGDTPLIKHQTLQKMLDKLDNFSVCVLAFEDEKENSYGRLVLDVQGHIKKIVEFKDADLEEKKILLCNSGVMAIDGKKINEMIFQIKNDNVAQEFYLTDIVGVAGKMGLKRVFIQTEIAEVLGVNSRAELSEIEKIKQNQIRKEMLDAGVTLINPHSIYFSFDTKIAQDVIIHPHVVFGKWVSISENVEIKSFCHIEGAEISSGCVVGPFARIRPETKIAKNVRIGNFVEIKKSQVREGVKINHLSYIGDSEIGANSNIGAGTITCNYDGYKKFKTKIGKDVFIGSNTALIAPIEIGDNVVIGAGSVISKNVNKNNLAIARGKQIEIKDGGKKYHQIRKIKASNIVTKLNKKPKK
jgi:bifunctional UDP-N-acetylglucosamine pyrophosphorylase/glucosamine-1-phosphate N-acetyltransferase